MTSSTKDENKNEYGGAKNVMRSCVGGTEKPPAMGWDRWKVTKRNLCCWREASTAFPVPVGEASSSETYSRNLKLRCMDSGFCRALLSLMLMLMLWNMEGLVCSGGLDIPKPPHWTILNELIDR